MNLPRCSKCATPCLEYAKAQKTREQLERQEEAENERIIEILNDLKEREKRKMMRLLKTGEIDYDAKLDKLVWTESQVEVDLDEKADDGQSDGSDW